MKSYSKKIKRKIKDNNKQLRILKNSKVSKSLIEFYENNTKWLKKKLSLLEKNKKKNIKQAKKNGIYRTREG